MSNNREIQRKANRGRTQEDSLITELRRQIRATEQTESLLLDAQIDVLTAASQEEFRALVEQFEIFLKEIFVKGFDWLEYGTTNDRFIAFTKKLAQTNPTSEVFHLFMRFATQIFKDLELEVFYIL